MPKWVTSGFKAGDLVIFDFPNTSSVTDHIGIVESVNGSTLTTIEGNTSPSSTSGSQDNGEGVYRKKRTASQVHGAYRPDYTTTMTATKLLSIARGEIGYVEGSNNNNKYGIAYGLNNQPWCVIFVWWCFKQASMSSLFCGGAKVADCKSVKTYAQNNSTSTTTMNIKYCTPKLEIIQQSTDASKGAVQSLQALLNAKGFKGADGKELTVDGEFGSNTAYALGQAQTKLGLTPDHSCGADTYTALIAMEV